MESCEHAYQATAERASARVATGASARVAARAIEGKPDTGTGSPNREQSETTPGPVAASETIEAIIVSCLMNAHYHAGREAFLDTVHRWFMLGVIVLGGAALIDIFPEDKKAWLKGICSAGAALLGALDLTFDLSNRARMHSMMRRRYFDLLASVREGKMTLAEARVCLERYSGDEEPPYQVLVWACWNRAEISIRGGKARIVQISKWAMVTKNLARRPSARYFPKEPTDAQA